MPQRESQTAVPSAGRVIGRHDDSIYDLAFVGDYKQIVSAGRDSTLRLWRLAGGTLERQWDLDAPARTAISADGDLAATCTRAGTVVIVATDAAGFMAAWPCEAPETVLLVGGGTTLLTGGSDGVVRWWDVPTRREVDRVAVESAGSIVRLRLSPDGRTLAASTQRAGAVFLDLAAAAVRRAVLPDYGCAVHVFDCVYLDNETCAASVQVRHDGRIGTTEDPDLYEILVWQPEHEEPPTDRTLLGHTNWIARLAVAPAGDLLASASMDTTVGIWEPPRALGFLRGHGDAVYAVCFTPNGDELLTASADRTIRAWGVEDQLRRPVAQQRFSLEELVRNSSSETRFADPVHVLARDITEALLTFETPAALEDALSQLVEVTSPPWSPVLRAINQTVTVLREQAQREDDAPAALRLARIDAMAQKAFAWAILATRHSQEAEPAYELPEGPGTAALALLEAFLRAVETGNTDALAAMVGGKALPAADLLVALGEIQANVWPLIERGPLDPTRVAPAARLLASAETDDTATRLLLLDIAGRMLGIAQWNEGAIDVLQRGLEAARAARATEDETVFLGNLANAYRNAGRLAEAERAYEQLIDLSPRSEVLANNLSNLALVHSDRGELEQAAVRAQAALAVAKGTDDDQLRTQIELNLAGYYHQLGDDERAVRLLEKTVARAERIGHDRLHSQALGNLAQCLVSLGELDAGRAQYEDALEAVCKLGDKSGEVHVLAGLGAVARELGDVNEAAKRFREAADLAAKHDLPHRLFPALASLADVLEDAVAVPVLEQAAALGEELRLQPGGSDVAEALLDVHARLVALSIAAHDPATAFVWAERSRIALLAELHAMPLDGKTVTGELRRVADAVVLISWFEARGRLYVFVVDGRDATVSVEVESMGRELDRAAELVQLELARDDAVGETWDELAVPAIRAVLPRLAGAELVVLAPHGGLFNLPLHAIRVDGRRLIERWPVAYVPAASVLPRLVDDANPPRAPGVVGAFFATEAERVAETLGVDASLVGVAVDKTEVLDLLREHDLVHVSSHGFFSPYEPRFSGWILDPSLDVLDYLRARRKREFERPHEDVLTLSSNEEAARAAILSAADLTDAQLAARHVTMSACETGLVAMGPTDDPAGLVPALLRTGVRSVLATLWRVDPDVTEAMMIDFYRRLDQRDGWRRRVQILRDVVLKAIRERPNDPHDWAPFVLVGGLVERAP
jgi:CHAT domain-containing protein/tetratricopeptide (TPR) repeat protein